jgi:alkylation response protein AidB-like acyl-CoA dehydrogenase
MSVTQTELRRKQIEQAEELLFSGPEKVGFAKDLFFGRFRSESIIPYPSLPPELEAATRRAVDEVRQYARDHIDAARIDRESLIPDDVVLGLGRIGVLGMCVSPRYGGRGFSQQQYCRIMEVIGAYCGGTTVFVNAHHSIGLRALELFGTTEQKERWLPTLCTGKTLAAFALTEAEAGSDAANVRTVAKPSPDGRGFVLNGTKRYITNGAIAGVLTVMARTPDPKEPDGKVTAFLITPDMPGFEVVEARMDKVGIRGTATARLAFKDMFVPKENILGEYGKGLRLALTVLDFGRTTFGASCTGVAKFCLEEATKYANERRQFGKTLGEFDLVREKIALAAAEMYAMESATYHTAALIDTGAEDYMLETSMIKLFASDALWRIVNDTLQIHGGAGFFTDRPFERMMRDARLNLIGEGANDVLRCFNAMVGLRNLGKELQSVLKKPWRAVLLWRSPPRIPVQHSILQKPAGVLAKQIARFARACIRALVHYREGIIDHEFVQARLGDTATELFHESCVYARLSGLLSDSRVDDKARQRELQTGLCYLDIASRRNAERLKAIHSNNDDELNKTAEMWLTKS